MILRKVGLGAVIISLALLLSSCVEVRGDLSVSSAARINGEITYTLKKSSAAGVGLNSLAEVKSEASSNPEAQIGFCKDAPITEDLSNYILKCALKDALSDADDISASVTGGNIVFRYKANLDPSSTTGDQTNFGSVSIIIRFLDPVISYKENKVGLVRKIDDLTYQISGFANEPMNIEITANCSSRCGSTNAVPAPVPSTTANSIDQAAAIDAANKAAADKAAADKAAADLKAKQEADAKAAADKAAADLKAQQEAAEKAAADLKAQQEADAKAAAEKVATDLKAKQEADAKAAAEKVAADLKTKQEADAKAAADLKAKQEADAKVAAEKVAADLKAKQAADAKVAAEKVAADLKAKQAADAKAAADLKAKQAAAAKAAAAKAAAAKILADAKAKAAAAKKTTITCVNGKLTKKVTAIKPVCPKGYKKK